MTHSNKAFREDNPVLNLAVQFAACQILSEWPDDLQGEALIEAVAADERDDVIVWERFEDMPAGDVAVMLADMAESYVNFANQLGGLK